MFTPIDFKTWNRREIFYYFSEMAPTGYSLTVDLDITEFRKRVKEKECRFFPAYLWLVTKCLMEQEEFKLAYEDEVLGYYDTLTPLYAAYHEDDHTFSLMWTEYDEDFETFHASYLKNQDSFGANHGILSQPKTPPPPNAYTVSCVPWISFSHFAVHSYENKKYFFPSVEAGKFRAEGERLLMPLSITCHHAAADGYHVQLFLQRLQEEMDKF